MVRSNPVTQGDIDHLWDAWLRIARLEFVANTGDEAYEGAGAAYAFRDVDPAEPLRRPDGPPGLGYSLRWAARRVAEAAGCIRRADWTAGWSWRGLHRLRRMAHAHDNHPLLVQAADAYAALPAPPHEAVAELAATLQRASVQATDEERRAAFQSRRDTLAQAAARGTREAYVHSRRRRRGRPGPRPRRGHEPRTPAATPGLVRAVGNSVGTARSARGLSGRCERRLRVR